MSQPTYQHLLEENERLRAENERLRRRVADLESQVARLTAQIAQALRAQKRQAAPFSKGPPKDPPATPGRKAGAAYGTPARRPTPRQKPDETHDAPLPAVCPKCHGPVAEDRPARQYQLDLPRRPILRRFDVHIGHCTRCGTRVQGHHPLQTSDALGAAKSQLGPDLQAVMVQLQKVAGMSHGKVADFLRTVFGIRVSRGGIAQVLDRVARRGAGLDRQIRAAVRQAPAAALDETGWRIGGHPAWLHVAATLTATAYHIDPHHGFDASTALLDADYAGVLIHDGWAPYDRFTRATHQQCLAHLLARCRRLLDVAVGGAVHFPRRVQSLLREALAVRDTLVAGRLSRQALDDAVWWLERRLDRLLTWIKVHPENERFARHLDRHQQDLFTFLLRPGVPATTWQAEQALRPAVVNRKVWGGNRTPRGAHTQAVLLTILRTAQQHARNTIALVSTLLRGHQPRLALLPAGP